VVIPNVLRVTGGLIHTDGHPHTFADPALAQRWGLYHAKALEFWENKISADLEHRRGVMSRALGSYMKLRNWRDNVDGNPGQWKEWRQEELHATYRKEIQKIASWVIAQDSWQTWGGCASLDTGVRGGCLPTAR
jgi:hypothetical protein